MSQNKKITELQRLQILGLSNREYNMFKETKWKLKTQVRNGRLPK